MFAFDIDTSKVKKAPIKANQFKSLLQLESGKKSNNDQITYFAQPLARNKVLFRFENLADRFDQVNQSDTKYIDVKRFAK